MKVSVKVSPLRLLPRLIGALVAISSGAGILPAAYADIGPQTVIDFIDPAPYKTGNLAHNPIRSGQIATMRLKVTAGTEFKPGSRAELYYQHPIADQPTGGVYIGSDTVSANQQGEFSLYWNTSGLEPGLYYVTVKIIEDTNAALWVQYGESYEIRENHAPLVTITRPLNNYAIQLGQTFNADAQVTDEDGDAISGTTFFYYPEDTPLNPDGTPVSSSAFAGNYVGSNQNKQGTYRSVNLPTTLAAGRYRLIAVASDGAKTTHSDPIAFVVGDVPATINCGNYPTFNGVILFSSPNCQEAGNGTDVRKISSPQSPDLYSAPFMNDRISSIYVGTGWSAKVYEHSGKGGAFRCVSGTTSDLAQYVYEFSLVGMNDSISTVEVFANTNCSNPQAIPTPRPPLNLKATAVSPTQINLSWTDYSSNEAEFVLERSPDGITYTQSWVLEPNTTSFQDRKNLNSFSTYYYRVKARNDGGSSTYATASATTLRASACPAYFSTGITLFDQPDCWEDSGPAGKRSYESVGLRNLASASENFDLRTSSIYIGYGWSILVKENAANGGGSRCLNAGYYPDLNTAYFAGSNRKLNDRISSVELFDDPNCVLSQPARYAISGRITRSDSGAGIPGAIVTRSSTDGAVQEPAVSVSADDQGYYTMSAVPVGTYTLTVAAAGWSFNPNFRAGVAITNANVTNQHFSGLPVPACNNNCKIHGRISDANSAALANITVTRTFNGATSTAQTNTAGYYVFSGVSAGYHTIRPSSTQFSFAPVSSQVAVTNGDVTGRNFTGHTAYSIRGKVVNRDGKPVAGVKVMRSGNLTRSGNLIYVVTDAAGEYGFHQVPPGTYTLTPEVAGYGFIPLTRTVTIANASSIGQDFTAASTFTIAGRIASPSGRSLSGVTVYRSGSSVPTLTNTAGYYMFKNLPPETYTITPVKSGFGFNPANRMIELVNTDLMNRNFVAVEQLPEVDLQGRITTPGGVGVPNARVVAVPKSAEAAVPAYAVVSDANGDYRFVGLPTGGYTLRAELPGHAITPPSRDITLAQEGMSGIGFTADTRFQIAGRIVDASGKGVTNQGVKLVGTNTTVTTNGAGYYLFTNLASNTYTVQPLAAVGKAFAPESHAVTISGANVAGKNFLASTPHSIAGRVTSSTGAAVENVTVQLSGGSAQTAQTNSAGYYLFSQVPAGRVTITPSLAGVVFNPPSLTVTVATQDLASKNFVTASPLAISGRIVTPTGAAAAGVVVGLVEAQRGPSGYERTNSAGYFFFKNLSPGSYRIVPASVTYAFTPFDRQVTLTTADVANQNFKQAAPNQTGTGSFSITQGPDGSVLYEGECSPLYKLTRPSGTSAVGLSVSLAGEGIQFFESSDTECKGIAMTELSLPAGTSSREFRIRGAQPAASARPIFARHPNYGPASKSVTIEALPVASILADYTTQDDDRLSRVKEGDQGTIQLAAFRVTLDKPTRRRVDIAYFTKNGTAVASTATNALGDYQAVKSDPQNPVTVTVYPGERESSIWIDVNGDRVSPEPDESFYVTLEKPVGAALDPAHSTAMGQIVDLAPFTATIAGVASYASPFRCPEDPDWETKIDPTTIGACASALHISSGYCACLDPDRGIPVTRQNIYSQAWDTESKPPKWKATLGTNPAITDRKGHFQFTTPGLFNDQELVLARISQFADPQVKGDVRGTVPIWDPRTSTRTVSRSNPVQSINFSFRPERPKYCNKHTRPPSFEVLALELKTLPAAEQNRIKDRAKLAFQILKGDIEAARLRSKSIMNIEVAVQADGELDKIVGAMNQIQDTVENNLFAAYTFTMPINIIRLKTAFRAIGLGSEYGFSLAKSQLENYSISFDNLGMGICNYGLVNDLMAKASAEMAQEDIYQLYGEVLNAAGRITACYSMNVAILGATLRGGPALQVLGAASGLAMLFETIYRVFEEVERTGTISDATKSQLNLAVMTMFPIIGPGFSGHYAYNDLLDLHKKGWPGLDPGEPTVYSETVCRILNDVTAVVVAGAVGKLVGLSIYEARIAANAGLTSAQVLANFKTKMHEQMEGVDDSLPALENRIVDLGGEYPIGVKMRETYKTLDATDTHYMTPQELAQCKATFDENGVARIPFEAGAPMNGRYAFVMDQHGNFYFTKEGGRVGPDGVKRRILHSSFFGGKPVAGAGEITFHIGKDGVSRIVRIEDNTGHYTITHAQYEQIINALVANGVDLDGAEPAIVAKVNVSSALNNVARFKSEFYRMWDAYLNDPVLKNNYEYGEKVMVVGEHYIESLDTLKKHYESLGGPRAAQEAHQIKNEMLEVGNHLNQIEAQGSQQIEGTWLRLKPRQLFPVTPNGGFERPEMERLDPRVWNGFAAAPMSAPVALRAA